MTALEIRLLGDLAVVRNGQPVELPASKKTRALLAYLVVTGQAHLRERLCDLLWDGPNDPRGELRWSLSKLRPIVDQDVARIIADRERVRFDAAGAVIDVAAIRGLVGPSPAGADHDVLVAAAGQFRGELLEGLDLPNAHRFHAWCVAEREALRQLHIEVLRALIEPSETDRAEALFHARRWIEVDPFSQTAHARAISLLSALGRGREAIEHYDETRRMLARELGVEAGDELREARRRVRHRSAGTVASQSAPARAVPAAPSAPRYTPLFGRERETQIIEAAVQKLFRGAGGVVLLFGEPGIGKTRLIEEVADLVEATGGLVLRGRAFESEMVRAYGAWIDALRMLPELIVPPDLRGHLAQLLPELGDAAGIEDRTQLFDAVTTLLSHLADAAPVAVLLDDVQWFDEGSAALLHYATRALRGARVLFALAAREVELNDNAGASASMRELRRFPHTQVIWLETLDDQSTAGLVRAIDARVDVQRVIDGSGGNPLFALEAARSLACGGTELSDRLDQLINDRLSRLPASAHDTIGWAAALGRSFDPEKLQRVMAVAASELLSAIGELERNRFIQPAAASRYDFSHDVVRQAAYRRLSPPRRKLIHLNIARRLREQADPTGALASEIAHHALLGGDAELTALACALAAEHSLRLFAYSDAIELAGRGLQQMPQLVHLPRAERIKLHLDLLRAYVHAGGGRRRVQELEAELSVLIMEGQSAGLHALVSAGFHIISFLHWAGGNFASAAVETLQSAEAGRAADPETSARALADAARCLAHLERDLPHAEALVIEAEKMAQYLNIELIDIPWARALLAQQARDLDTARHLFEQTLELSSRASFRWGECDALTRLTMIELEQARYEAALSRSVDLARVAALIRGEGSEAPFAAALAALARYASHQEDAPAELEAAIQALRHVDNKQLLAYTLVFAAELDSSWQQPELAHMRAQAALFNAEAVGARRTAARARSLLARLAQVSTEVSTLAPTPVS